jgi:HSP20 family protein
MNGLSRWNRNTPERKRRRDPFTALQREINDLFDRDFWDFGNMPSLFDEGFSPAIDVKDHENRLEVRCDLPGVDKDDVDVTVSDNVLTVKGEKKGETEDKDGDYYRKESWSGSFQRSVQLPDSVNTEKAEAEMKNGVLTLTLPKKEEGKRKQIDVKVK